MRTPDRRTDTLVFPSWKSALPTADIGKTGDQLEDIERAIFDGNGFDDAVRSVAHIVEVFGFTDQVQINAPLPAQPLLIP